MIAEVSRLRRDQNLREFTKLVKQQQQMTLEEKRCFSLLYLGKFQWIKKVG